MPAPETARRCGKGKAGRAALPLITPVAIAAGLLVGAGVAQALPTGAQVTSGQVTVQPNIQPGGLTIQQGSQKAVINWQSFGIASGESVTFVQPNASAVALNRVVGSEPSAIFGKLNSNGQVFLINPSGVLFGRGAEVNVGGLVASTLNLSDADFLAGKRSFAGSSTAAINNLGTINADGGYVALLGTQVVNQGTIQARLGTVVLAAGQRTTLDFAGDRLISVQVDEGALNSLVDNSQLIQADGGSVVLTARAAGDLLSGVVNNSGVIRARTLQNRAGVISLMGDMQTGQANVGGTLDASAPDGGDGGFIETSAAKVHVGDGAFITTLSAQGQTGHWLVDPTDFNVGGANSDMSGATLSAALALNNVELSSEAGSHKGQGDVNINDPVSWSTPRNLTLTASNSVNVNANMTATSSSSFTGVWITTGTGTFNLAEGVAINLPNVLPASTNALQINGTIYKVINRLGTVNDSAATTLQGLQNDAKNGTGMAYALGSDLDATATSTWNGGAGFTPIGDFATDLPFSGILNGLGHKVVNLTINRPTTDYVGLFGYTLFAEISNVRLVNASVRGQDFVGALVGYTDNLVDRSHSAGTVSGRDGVGGLVGWSDARVSNSSSSTSVSGANFVGGLVGYNAFDSVRTSRSDGIVSGSDWGVGGLVGQNDASVVDSESSATVSGGSAVGGLVGNNLKSISRSRASGTVHGASLVGGLVGYNADTGTIATSQSSSAASASAGSGGGLVGDNEGAITTSQASGLVSGPTAVGGLVGYNGLYGTISNAYATGNVISTDDVGGLVGRNGGLISNAYATGGVSGSAHVGGLVGRNGGWISYAYATGGVSGSAYVGGLVGYSFGGGSRSSFWDKTSSGQATSAGGVGLTAAQMQSAVNFTTATAENGQINPYWDVTSTWVHYDGYTAPLLRAFMAPLTVTVTANKTYDGQAYAGGGYAVSYSSPVNGNLFGTPTYASNGSSEINAGTYANGVSATGGLYSNQQGYVISYAGALTINPKPLSVTGAIASNKVYDGSTAATVTGGNLGGVIGGDVVALSGTWTFATKNAGSGIAVNNLLEGASAGNYTTAGVAASITPKPLSMTGSIAGNKVYDGTTAAPIGGGTLSGVIAGDAVAVGASWTFASKNVGSGIAVNGLLTGASAGNYSTAGFTASITPKPISVIGSVAVSKVYDGSTAATVSGGSLSGVISGDAVSLNQSGSFVTKNVGVGIAVSTADSLSGASAGNYSLQQPAGLSASIAPKPLSVTGSMVAGKIYDGSAAATVSGGTLSGVISGDTVSLNQSGSFVTKNVGVGIAVSTADSLGGASAGNYSLQQPAGLLADITPKSISVTGSIAGNKVYDGSTAATVSGGSLSGLIPGDAVSLSQSGSFAGKSVGVGIAVVAAHSLGGASATNYSLQQPMGLLADITPRPLSVIGSIAANKVYDGSRSATVSGGSLSGVIAGDSVSLSQSGTFVGSNVGVGFAVSTADILGGASAANYSLLQPLGLSADITPKVLVVSGAVASDKVYDGTTKAKVVGGTIAQAEVIAGDTVALSKTWAFAGKNAGSGIAVNNLLKGTSAGNYVTTGVTASITPKVIKVSGTRAANKVYDNSTAATISGGRLSGLVRGDSVVLAQTGSFADDHAARSKPVAFSNQISGVDAGNYSLFAAGGTVKATITPLKLTVVETGLIAADRAFDGSKLVGVSGALISGVLAGDEVELLQAGSFSTTTVGANKVVTVKYGLTGVDAADYSLSVKGAKTTASILP